MNATPLKKKTKLFCFTTLSVICFFLIVTGVYFILPYRSALGVDTSAYVEKTTDLYQTLRHKEPVDERYYRRYGEWSFDLDGVQPKIYKVSIQNGAVISAQKSYRTVDGKEVLLPWPSPAIVDFDLDSDRMEIEFYCSKYFSIRDNDKEFWLTNFESKCAQGISFDRDPADPNLFRQKFDVDKSDIIFEADNYFYDDLADVRPKYVRNVSIEYYTVIHLPKALYGKY